MSDSSISEKLETIQSQLAMLQSDYKNILRTYYNMFYNSTPMDITLKLYAEDGSVETIVVPNRAKDATIIKTYHGSPINHVTAGPGTFCLDTSTSDIYYNPQQGSMYWKKMLTSENFEAAHDYLQPNGDGSELTNLNISSVTKGVLSTVNGGTGLTDFDNGTGKGFILKGMPATYDSTGKVTRPPYITQAVEDVDFITSLSFVGVICYMGVTQAPLGFLPCDGSYYPISYVDEHGIVQTPYKALYDHLTTVLDQYGTPKHVDNPFGPDLKQVPDENLPKIEGEVQRVDKFCVPNLHNLFVRGTLPILGARAIASLEDDAIPNIQGNWAQEITGVREEFKGAISIARDEDGNPKMVTGSTSAPGGQYDYVINFNASDYNEATKRVYSDDATEVTVKNMALLPVIKY